MTVGILFYGIRNYRAKILREQIYCDHGGGYPSMLTHCSKTNHIQSFKNFIELCKTISSSC